MLGHIRRSNSSGAGSVDSSTATWLPGIDTTTSRSAQR
jgi:hypothetical protein